MRIFAIGKNYVKHIEELQGTIPSEPVVFMKPESALLTTNNFNIPSFAQEFHYELEIVLKICKKGKNISKNSASEYYDSIGLGIDFTARDLQSNLKQNKLPWELCKSFDGSAAVGKFEPKINLEASNKISFELKKNETTVQSSDTSKMIFDFDTIISFLSQFFSLEPNDLIFTGTPEGVGKVDSGDKLKGFLNNNLLLDININ